MNTTDSGQNVPISPGPGAPEMGDVHLGTGQVQFSLPLATINAGPHVRYDLALSYSSAGAAAAKIWNLNAPTGLVGLGWAMGKDCVTRMPSSDASDMSVFLVLSGGVYPLVKCGWDELWHMDIYQSPTYEPWVIRHDPASDSWLVIKEDGVRYVFGGLASPTLTGKTSAGNSIEWAVERCDWIGSSSSLGQEQVAVIWNLSAQEDQWGNRLEFVYEQTLATVGSYGGSRKQYSRSCRLKQISRKDGGKIELTYAKKGDLEYTKPHRIAGPQGSCRIRVRLTTQKDWDGWSTHPHLIMTVVSDGVDLGTYEHVSDKRTDTVEWEVDLKTPALAGDTVDVKFEARNGTSPSSDLLIAFGPQSLLCNAGHFRTSQRTKCITTVEIEYIHFATEKDGPDAYQDRYEESYLEQVCRYDDAGRVVARTKLDFDFLGPGTSAEKRLLAKVSRYNADGQLYEPPHCFEYYTRPEAGAREGALKLRTLPAGAQISYQYTQVDIPSAPLKIDILRPENDSKQWGNPRTYMGPGYCLVIWELKSGGKIYVSVYAWVGYWAGSDLGEMDAEAIDKVLVRLGPDFVAMMPSPDKGTPLVVISQCPFDPTRWYQTSFDNKGPRPPGSPPLVEVGVGFVAFLDPSNGQLKIFEKSNSQVWQEWTHPLQHVEGSRYALAAQGQYVFALSVDESNAHDAVAYLFYRTQPSSWKEKSQAFPRLFWSAHLSDSPAEVTWQDKAIACQSSATFVVVQSSYRRASVSTHLSVDVSFHEHVAFRWSEDLPGLVRERLGDEIFSSGTESVILDVIQDTVSIDVVRHRIDGDVSNDSRKHLFRFLGNGWEHTVLPFNGINSAYRDSDACTTSKDGWAQYRQLDPNTLAWLPKMKPYEDGNPTFAQRWWSLVSLLVGVVPTPEGLVGDAINALFLAVDLAMSSPNQGAAGHGAGRYYTAGQQVYCQDSYGEWNPIGPLNVPAKTTFVAQHTQSASRFISYVVSGVRRDGIYDKEYRTTLVQLLRNGQFGELATLPEGEYIAVSQNTVGFDSFVSHSGGPATKDFTMALSTRLHLYKVERERLTGARAGFVVSRVVVDDGFRKLCCDHEYDPAGALPAAFGDTVQFAKVTTYFRGDPAAPAKTNGYRESYFYARTTAQAPALSPQSADDLQTYASLFSGVEYATRVSGADGNQISLSIQELQVFSVPLVGKVQGCYTRPTVRTTIVDGTKTVSQSTFPCELKGFPSRTAIVTTDETGRAAEIVTEMAYEYAWRQAAYAADLCALNILDQVCLRTRKVRGQTTEITAVQWASAGTRSSTSPSRELPRMAPVRTYRALKPGVTFDFGGSSVDPSEWLCQSSVLKRDETHGIVTEVAELAADPGAPVVTSTIYDQKYRFVLATFVNASVSGGEAGYYGYQSYEDTAPWSLKLIGSTQRVAPTTFSPRAGAGAYVVSAYVQPRGAGGVSIGFGSFKTSPKVTSGAWQYVEYVTTSPSAASAPFVECDGLIRDFRFSPVDVSFSAATYDASTGRVISEIDDNGLKIEHHVDALLRPLAVVEPQGTVHKLFWRVEGARGASGFSPGQSWAVANRSAGNYVPIATYSSSSGSYNSYTTIIDQDSHGSPRNAVVQAQTPTAIDPRTSSGVTMELEIEGGVSAEYKYEKGGGKIRLGSAAPFTPPAPFSKWMLVAIDKQAWLWLDDNLVSQCTLASAVQAKKLVVKSYGPSMPTYLPQQIYGAYDPVLTAIYSDALGRPVQTQRLNDGASGRVVAQTLHDGWGNAAVRTKPMLYGSVQWQYEPKCVETFDSESGVMDGDVVRYYEPWVRAYESWSGASAGSQDYRYPYTRDLREANALGRTIAAGLPGEDFVVSSPTNNATFVEYGQNSDVDTLCQRLSLGPSREYCSARTVYTPGRVPRVSLSDPTQSLVASSVGSGSQAPIETTQRSYPSALLTATHLPPAAHQDGIPETVKASFATIRRHDFLGNPTQTVNGDAGATNVVCDALGRLRFVQTAAMLSQSPGVVAYYKYDALGRLQERGLLAGTTWDPQELQKLAEHRNYPDPQTPGLEVREQYFYDIRDSGDTTDLQDRTANLKNRLYKTIRTNGSSGRVSETFAYDTYGNLSRTTLEVDGGTTYTTQYTHDAFGNVTTIAYPRGSAPPLTVTYQFTSLGRVQSVGVADSPSRYAAYTYDIEGRVSQALLNNGKLSRTYRYDFLGQLVQICDQVGTSVVFQEDLGYLDPSGKYLAGRIAQATYTGQAVSSPYRYLYSYNQQGGLLEAVTTDVPSLKITRQPAWDVGSTDGPIQYDVQGNILRMKNIHGERVATYSTGTNQIDTLSKGTLPVTIEYEPSGCIQSSDKVGRVNYDVLDRLPSLYVLAGDGHDVSFAYDCRRRRVVKAVKLQGYLKYSRLYLHGGGSLPLAEITGTDQTQYVFGPGGMVAVIDGQGTGFVSRDHLGSTRAVTDSDGTVTNRFHFDPFGILLPGSSDVSRYRHLFTGQEYDYEADLHNYRLRAYDQDLGVFYATDPAGDYYSPYAYVRNDPVNLVDPTGATPMLRAVEGVERPGQVARQRREFFNRVGDHPVSVDGRKFHLDQSYKDGEYTFVTIGNDVFIHRTAGHPAVAHNAKVDYAGKILIRDSRLAYWNNWSGHYEPTIEHNWQANLPLDKFRPWEEVQEWGWPREHVLDVTANPVDPRRLTGVPLLPAGENEAAHAIDSSKGRDCCCVIL